MKILAVDDEYDSLTLLERAISAAVPEAELRGFGSASRAVAEVRGGFRADVAFLDIELPGMNGIELAKKMKDINPDMNIVFVTGFAEYALEALGLHASGYVLKPVSPEQVKAELGQLRTPLRAEPEKKLIVRTFQNFEVYAGDRPVEFERSKAKEIFAYLIDRAGTSASYAEVAAVIWEDGVYNRSRQKQLYNCVACMIKSLRAVGAEDVVVKNMIGIMVDTSKLDCDAYRFLEGDADAVRAYRGEYMSAYSWAKFSVGKFNKIV